MNRTYLPNYNLLITLLGGQSFGWDFDGEWFYGFTIDCAAKIKREGDDILWQTYPIKDNYEWLSKYLRLDVDYNNILNQVSKDQHVKAAIEAYPGLRLLKQNFEETLLSFLCSPTKSIVGIRQCTRLMAEKYGEKVKIFKQNNNVNVLEKEVLLFPKASRLAEVEVEDLLKCKVGFRATNIISAARAFAVEKKFENIELLTTEETLELLKSCRGIGDKVADCIAVYGLAKDEITPFDVWGKRFATNYYGLSEKAKYDELRQWFKNYFNGYAAWGGQFLFEYIRKSNGRG